VTGARWRGPATVACLTAGVITLLLGLLLGYASRAVFNSEAFAARVSASLLHPGVSGYVAERITDAVVTAKPDLIGLRPVIAGGARSVVASPPFRMAARRAAREAHRALMSGTGEKIMLSVRDVGAILNTALTLHPELAKKLPARLTARVADLDQLPAGEVARRAVRAAQRARYGTVAFVVIGLTLLVVGTVIAPDRRKAMFQAGVLVTGAALVLWLAARFGGVALAAFARDPAMGMLAAGLWRAFIGGLGTWALGLGLLGIVCAAAPTSVLENTPLERWLGSGWRWITSPHPGRAMAFTRGLVLVTIGLLTLQWPLPVLSVIALMAGGAITFLGLREVFVALIRSVPVLEAQATGAGAPRPGWNPALVVAAGAVVIGAVTATAFWMMRTPDTLPAASAITACNGYPELCERRLDEVVFATTHNSMAAADLPLWMFPNQERGVKAQLEDGVRGFLIDALYGVPAGERVKTILVEGAATVAKYEAVVGKEGVEAAMRIRDRLVGEDESRRAVYMAHGFCELGATPLTETFAAMREFLVANPGEILVLVIQDEGVDPADIVKCFEESGLIEFVYRGPARAPWPTLRAMAESDQRVLVMAENQTGGVPWYHLASEVLQETPYTFKDTTQFSEQPNRGGLNGSLMLLNHWIDSTPLPRPSNALVVNRYDFLMQRARRFEKLRGKVPNLVAVDFYATGDLMRVVQTLNGVGPAATSDRTKVQ
jgi:hypothetical protein